MFIYFSGIDVPDSQNFCLVPWRGKGVCEMAPILCHSSHMFGEGNGNPLQYPCPENPMDRGAWWAPVPGVTESRTQLNDLTHIYLL